MAAVYADPYYADDQIVIKNLSVGSMDNNVYVIVDPGTQRSAIVDACDGAERILAAVEGGPSSWPSGRPTGDWEHIQALDGVLAHRPVPVAIHPADAAALARPPDLLLEEGQELALGALRFRVIHTPGHSAGGVCCYTPGHLFAGNTLFPGGPGNTKRAGGDFGLIVRGIQEKLFVLPGDTRVYPGHGRDPTIGAEQPNLPEWLARGW